MFITGECNGFVSVSVMVWRSCLICGTAKLTDDGVVVRACLCGVRRAACVTCLTVYSGQVAGGRPGSAHTLPATVGHGPT